MDPNEFDHRYSREDALELLGAQSFSLVITVFAGIACGAAWFGAVLPHGEPMRFPYRTVASIALAGFAIYNAVAIPGRYAFIWKAPRARARISACLVQVAVTGTVIAIAAIVVAGVLVYLYGGNSIYAWGAYGALFTGILHTIAGLGALVLLKQGREIPDFED
jgi:hypothetical protein